MEDSDPLWELLIQDSFYGASLKAKFKSKSL